MLGLGWKERCFALLPRKRLVDFHRVNAQSCLSQGISSQSLQGLGRTRLFVPPPVDVLCCQLSLSRMLTAVSIIEIASYPGFAL